VAYTRSKHIADIGNINGGGNGPPQNAVCSMPVSLVQVQPTLAELRKIRGTNSVYHNNSIQTWQVKPDGSIFDVQLA